MKLFYQWLVTRNAYEMNKNSYSNLISPIYPPSSSTGLIANVWSYKVQSSIAITGVQNGSNLNVISGDSKILGNLLSAEVPWLTRATHRIV